MTTGPRVVVVGSGGREHAIARRLAADPEPARVVVIPGNEGMEPEFERRAADERDVDALAGVCAAAAPDLVVIGPEAPLAAGLADALAARGVPVFGPTRAAARLESSKWFAKQLMRDARVPTAEAACVETPAEADAAMPRFGPPWVIKADGLAAGKGVLVTSDAAEAAGFVRACLSGARFGAAGTRVLLERHLDGDELSVMAVCDGERAVLLPAARDYKRAGDGDQGPNTGGMGSFAPTETLDAAGEAEVRERIVLPVLAALARRGAAYRGVLYCGLMRTRVGLRVVEFNARFGDPEAQVVLPLTGGSLFGLLRSAAHGRLAVASPRVPGAAVAVAIVDDAYPGPASGEALIERAADAAVLPGAWVLFAGVRRARDGWRITGGRGAYVCASGGAREEARARAYAAVDRLGGRGWRCRRDIAAASARLREPALPE